MNQEDQEAYSHFKETLDTELRQNVKTVIMSLTMLAEDYKQSGAVIVKAIEEYIKEVTPDIKILGLYLMDSITKNLKPNTNYVELFQKNLINIFTHVFSNVNEHNRAALYKLRQTWNAYFSNNTLFAIDVTINKIDPAWPITAAVNTTTAPASITPTGSINSNRNPPSVNSNTTTNSNNLLAASVTNKTNPVSNALHLASLVSTTTTTNKPVVPGAVLVKPSAIQEVMIKLIATKSFVSF